MEEIGSDRSKSTLSESAGLEVHKLSSLWGQNLFDHPALNCTSIVLLALLTTPQLASSNPIATRFPFMHTQRTFQNQRPQSDSPQIEPLLADFAFAGRQLDTDK